MSVGSMSYGDLELDSISEALINLTTMGFRENDSSRCPTLKRKASYRLVGATLMPVDGRK